MEKDNHKVQCLIMAIVVGIIWGSAFLAIALVLDVLEPIQIMTLRWTCALLVFLVLLALKVIKVKFTKKDLPLLMIGAILAATVYPFFEGYAIRYTSASLTSIFESFMPCMAIIIGMIFFKKKTSAIGVLSIALAIIGVTICTVFAPGFSSEGKILGYILLLITIIATAGYSQASAKAGERTSPITVSVAMAVIGAVVNNAINFAAGYGFDTYVTFFTDWRATAAVLFLGVGSSAIAFLCYNRAMAISHDVPVTANLVSGITTVVGVVLGITVVGDVFGIYTIVGMIITLCGIALSTRAS